MAYGLYLWTVSGPQKYWLAFYDITLHHVHPTLLKPGTTFPYCIFNAYEAVLRELNCLLATHAGFDVNKVGDARVGLVGFPSVGKSTLLTKLTGTMSEVRLTSPASLAGKLYKARYVQLGRGQVNLAFISAAPGSLYSTAAQKCV